MIKTWFIFLTGCRNDAPGNTLRGRDIKKSITAYIKKITGSAYFTFGNHTSVSDDEVILWSERPYIQNQY